jgi:hypothetical protein
MGIKGKLLVTIISTYDRAKEQIRIGPQDSAPFHLQFGLRQGSILSPILFIIYVNDLIKALDATGTGVHGNGELMELRVASLMFVDDIETYTHETESLSVQYSVAIDFARTHNAVLNTVKSTVTSSIGTTALQAIKSKMNIQLEIQSSTKQLGTRICSKEMRYPDADRPSTDVSARCGATASMCKTMISRGMQAGDMALPDILTITKSIVQSSLTFGLACADLTRKDKNKLRATLAIVAGKAVGLEPDQDPTNTWAALELGLQDPVDLITITDWTAVVGVMHPKANRLAAKVVTADSTLEEALDKVKDKWDFSFAALAAHPGKREMIGYRTKHAPIGGDKRVARTLTPTEKPSGSLVPCPQHMLRCWSNTAA